MERADSREHQLKEPCEEDAIVSEVEVVDIISTASKRHLASPRVALLLCCLPRAPLPSRCEERSLAPLKATYDSHSDFRLYWPTKSSRLCTPRLPPYLSHPWVTHSIAWDFMGEMRSSYVRPGPALPDFLQWPYSTSKPAAGQQSCRALSPRPSRPPFYVDRQARVAPCDVCSDEVVSVEQ